MDPLTPADLTPAEIEALDAAAKTLREALDNE
jgi:hypothetical protein